MSRSRALVLAAVASAALCVTASLPAAAASVPGRRKVDQGASFRFVATGQCLSTGPRSRDGDAVVLTNCRAARSARWKLTPSVVQVANGDAGTSEIISNRTTGLCLDGNVKRPKSGAKVVLRPCVVDSEIAGEPIDSQAWLVFDEKDIATIKNLATGMCLGQSVKSARVGAEIHQYDCDLGPRQQWKIAR
jgi:ricin-type beta-trefoil lectin protein